MATLEDMSEEAAEFFASISFGAIVFPLGDELPTKISDGDLDGDLYLGVWDEDVLKGISTDDIQNNAGVNFLSDDDVVGIEFKYEINGTERNATVVQKIGENPDEYNVEVKTQGEIAVIKMTKQQIYDGKDFISKVVGHRVKGKQKKYYATVEFNCVWENGANTWNSAEDLHKRHSGAPQELVEYVQKKDLLQSGYLRKNICKWIKEGCGDAVLLKITNHRTVDGNIEVCCLYDDGTEDWEPMKEVKEDGKLILGAYAKEKHLFRQPGWKQANEYWFQEVHDVLCKQMRANEIDQLVTRVYANFEKAFDDLGPNHPETIIWGRAYKHSLEIEKHGGRITLPLYLFRTMSPKLRRHWCEC